MASAAAAHGSASAVPRLVAGVVERPRLFALLARESPVTLLCAPAGSGKTMLLASWLRSTPHPAVAWVGVERGEADATRFWSLVLDALRGAGAVAPGEPLATLAPAPAGGEAEFAARVLDGLARLARPAYLVLDDLHELCADAALRDLECLLSRPPPALRVFIVSRRDPKLGLHRLRLAGDLTEIRGPELGFSAAEAGELLAATGLAVPPPAVDRLRQRTEGWAAGLRLAAMSLARHEEPERFVAEFSGSERTVAGYLLEEVLAGMAPDVRRLLLCTCILERVCGPLADALTGRADGARLLHELEEANAFVVALDVARSWFRYHHLLGDLLRLELRREAPEEIPRLHRLAALWHAGQGHAIEAIRHAQLGEDRALAAELLGRHWVQLVLDGEEATLRALLAGLPPGVIETDAEVAAIAAAVRLTESRWAEADALLATAQGALDGLPEDRRRRAETALVTVRLLRARRLGDLDAVVDEAGAMLHDGGPDGGGAEREALALMNLGIVQSWTWRLAESEANLETGLALAGRIGRPYVEVGCLAALGSVATLTGRSQLGEARLRQAIAIGERVGWSAHPLVGVAHMALAAVLIDHGRLHEAEPWLERAGPALGEAPEPPAVVALRHTQGMLHMAQGRFTEALAAFRDATRLTQRLRAPHFLALVARQWELRSLLRLGDAEPVRAALAGEAAEGLAQWCNLAALVALHDGDAARASAAVAPVLAGTAIAVHLNQRIEACLLDGLARARLGEREAAEGSVERALALAEPQGSVWIVLTVPGARELLGAHPLHRTAHAAQLKALLDLLSGAEPAPAAAHDLAEPLSERELAVLRFLPTNLSAAEIGGELFLSVHTVKTHMRKLYAKLDVHTRAEAVQQGRALGLLARPLRAA
jgi:LuxR family maltose regulon positive regulatory protein